MSDLKCQCMNCAYSHDFGITRSCSFMMCVKKHCAECRQVMAKCSLYITPEQLNKQQEEEKKKRQESKKIKLRGA